MLSIVKMIHVLEAQLAELRVTRDEATTDEERQRVLTTMDLVEDQIKRLQDLGFLVGPIERGGA